MEEKRGFIGGLDMDSDERAMDDNSYRYALNIRNSNSEQGAEGAISMLEGNQTKGTIPLPAGANKIVGCIDDASNDRLIYILYNSNGNNRVLCFDYKTDSLYNVFKDEDNKLELTSMDKISGINLSRGEQDTYLLFVNSNGEPKNINVDAGLRTYSVYNPRTRFMGAWISGDTYYTGNSVVKIIEIEDVDGNTQLQPFYYRAKTTTSNDPTSAVNSFTPSNDWEICPSGYIYSSHMVKLVNSTGTYTGNIIVGDNVTQATSLADGDVAYFDSTGSTETLFLINVSGTFDTSGTLNSFPSVGSISGGTWDITVIDNLGKQITQIVKPPQYKSQNLYSTNTKYPFNNLKGSLWQFKYKYQAADGRESSWSEVSDAPPAFFKSDAVIESKTFQTVLDNNEINLYLDVPDTLYYKKIKVAVRRSNNDKSPDNWYLMEDIPVTDYNNYVYKDKLKIRATFNNSNVLMPANSREINQLFSWVPRDVEAQTITNKNRVVYANFTEGRDFYLEGEYGIKQNPPNVRFRESNNPWVSPESPCTFNVYTASASGAATYDLALASTATTRSANFETPVNSVNSATSAATTNVVAISFADIVVGQAITLKVYVENFYTIFPYTDRYTWYQENPSSFEYTYIPTSTAVSEVIDAFTSILNDSENFSFNIRTLSATGSAKSLPYYSISAFTGTSTAGTSGDYLYIQPKTASNFPTNGTNASLVKMIDIKNSSVSPQLNFKRGTTQSFGLVYEGDFGRKSSVIRHPSLDVENYWWKDTAFEAVTASGIAGNVYNDIGARYALMDLLHDAPSWATKYYIVKSLDNGIENYVQLPLVKHAKLPDAIPDVSNPFNDKYFLRGYLTDPDADSSKAATATSLGGGELIYLTLNALQGNPESYSELNKSVINYEYSKGDRVRFCFNTVESASAASSLDTFRYITEDVDMEIVSHIPAYNAIGVRVNDFPEFFTDSAFTSVDLYENNFSGVFAADNTEGSGSGNGAASISGLFFEVYTPTRERSDNFYYELYSGVVSADTANSRYYHLANGLDEEVNQTSASAATLRLHGDSYLKPRTYPIRVDPTIAANLVTTADTRYITSYIEEANLFDKIESKVWGAGSVNRVVKNTSQDSDYAGSVGSNKLATTLRYSEPFIPEQGYNGYGTIYDLNFQDTNSTKKPIRKLYTEGDRLIIIHEDAIGHAQSDRQVIETIDGQGLTIAANTPISEPSYYGTDNGTLHPESFTVNGYRKYFYDNNNGEICRLSKDGVVPISDAKIRSWINKVSRENEQGFISKVVGAYDARFDTYSLAFYRTVLSSGLTVANPTPNTIEVTISGISGYDVKVGDIVGVRVFYNGSSTDYLETSAEVTDITGTTVTLEFSSADYTTASEASSIYVHLPNVDIITFSEKLGKWTSFAGYNPDWFTKAGINFVSWEQGVLYTHDDYDNPCNFYGTAHDAYIDIVSNSNPTAVKQWQTIALNSDVTWGTAATFTPEIEVPLLTTLSGTDNEMDAGVITGNDQRTSASEFEYKEQQLYASYFKAKDAAAATYFEGDFVKGFWQKTRIKFNGGGTKIYKVFSVMFKYITSGFTR